MAGSSAALRENHPLAPQNGPSRLELKRHVIIGWRLFPLPPAPLHPFHGFAKLGLLPWRKLHGAAIRTTGLGSGVPQRSHHAAASISEVQSIRNTKENHVTHGRKYRREGYPCLTSS